MATTNFPAPNFVFSEPYIKTKLILVGNHSNSFEYTGMASLEDKQIGGILGWGLANAFPQFNWSEVNNINQLFTKLRYKRSDVFMYEELATVYSQNNLADEIKRDIVFLNNQIAPVFYGIAIDKNNVKAKAIIEAFNSGLALI